LEGFIKDEFVDDCPEIVVQTYAVKVERPSGERLEGVMVLLLLRYPSIVPLS
jgi:hypothetical protein